MEVQDNDVLLIEGVKYIVTHTHKTFAVILNEQEKFQTLVFPIPDNVKKLGKGRLVFNIEVLDETGPKHISRG